MESTDKLVTMGMVRIGSRYILRHTSDASISASEHYRSKGVGSGEKRTILSRIALKIHGIFCPNGKKEWRTSTLQLMASARHTRKEDEESGES